MATRIVSDPHLVCSLHRPSGHRQRPPSRLRRPDGALGGLRLQPDQGPEACARGHGVAGRKRYIFRL